MGDRVVLLLPGEGAQLHRQQQGILVGKGLDVIRGTRDAGSASDAPETEDGGAFDVLGEAHSIGKACVNAGAGDASDRSKKNRRNIRRLEPRLIERTPNCLLAEFDRSLDPEVIHGAEALERAKRIQGIHDVAVVDAAVAMEPFQDRRNLNLVLHALLQRLGNDSLRISVGRKCGSYRCNAHGNKKPRPRDAGNYALTSPSSAIDWQEVVQACGRAKHLKCLKHTGTGPRGDKESIAYEVAVLRRMLLIQLQLLRLRSPHCMGSRTSALTSGAGRWPLRLSKCRLAAGSRLPPLPIPDRRLSLRRQESG